MGECTSQQLSTAWGQVLQNVQHALEQAEALAAQREGSLEICEPEPGATAARERLWRDCEARMAARAQSWQDGMQRMDETVRTTHLELQGDEDTLKQWLQDLQTVGQVLANWAAPPI